MEGRVGPRRVTSKRIIKYRRSGWEVREFEGASCRGGVVRVQGSVLAWAGAGGGGREARLGELALAVPEAGATPLLAGEVGAAPQLARRLAARLRRPVYVALGDSFDRFTLPLVENALLSQITQITAQ